MSSLVTQVKPAPSDEALAHFQRAFQFETDCWDVHEALRSSPDFVLLDVRGPTLYAQGHVPGAINVPHAKIVAGTMAKYPQDTVFVVYCAGPHCKRCASRCRAPGAVGPAGESHARRHHGLARRGLRTRDSLKMKGLLPFWP
jgi:3-mercaptopyruvate sulfurtransferase SseA